LHLFLARHGQSFVNLDDWDGGYTDTGLTPLGHQQAERLSRWLADNVRVDVLYTSTMARSQETAAYIAQATGVAARPDDRLREFGNCYADGTAVPPEAMPIQYAEFWGTERPHMRISTRGESWILFRARVGGFLDEVLDEYGDGEPDTTVVVVCHGGVIDAAFDHIFNVGIQRRVEIMSHNTSLVHWEYCPESSREIWRLHAHGLAHHLIDADGEWIGSRALLRDASRKGFPFKDDPPAHGD